jgi:hypothetical protein
MEELDGSPTLEGQILGRHAQIERQRLFTHLAAGVGGAA